MKLTERQAVQSTSCGRKTLSVVIPVYNEFDTWRELLTRVLAVDLSDIGLQIVMVDDCSTDGTRGQLEQFDRETAGRKVLAFSSATEIQ